MAYTLNPLPTYGSGAYGYVPGQLGMPDPYGDLSKAYPALGTQNKQAGNVITAQLGGQLSPETQMALQNATAAWGVGNMGGGSPTPGTITGNRGLRDLGLATEILQQQGLQNYGSIVPTISQTQTVAPALQSEIANINSINAAAPNPEQRVGALKDLYEWMLNEQRGPMGEAALAMSNMSSMFGSGASMMGSVGGFM